MNPRLQHGASDQEIPLKQVRRKGSSTVLNVEGVDRYAHLPDAVDYLVY